MSEDLELQGEWVQPPPAEEEEDLIIVVPLKTKFLNDVDASQYEDVADLVAGKAAKQAWLHMMRRLQNG